MILGVMTLVGLGVIVAYLVNPVKFWLVVSAYSAAKAHGKQEEKSAFRQNMAKVAELA